MEAETQGHDLQHLIVDVKRLLSEGLQQQQAVKEKLQAKLQALRGERVQIKHASQTTFASECLQAEIQALQLDIQANQEASRKL